MDIRAFIRRVEPYLTPLLAFSGLFFVSMIVITLLASWLGLEGGLLRGHLIGLISTVIATASCIAIFERGHWSLGIFVPWRRALRGLVRGLLGGGLIVCSADLLILVLSDYRHVVGDGMNLALVLGLILPAAFGEELLFRGYVLQKLYRTGPRYAVLVTSVIFALAHAGNPSMGLLSFANILLAGVVLALLWAWDGTLWAPAWGHVAWNVISGPVLGHELSGLDLGPTILSEVDPGPAWLTGGDFGIEASIVLTLVLSSVIVLLVWRIRSQEDALRKTALETARTDDQRPDILSGTSTNQIDEVERL